MKDKIQKIWKQHKGKIIIGSVVIVGGAIIFVLTRKTTASKIITDGIVNEEFGKCSKEINFGFGTLEEALAKFNELRESTKSKSIALWGGGLDGYEYLVQDLS